MAINKNRNVNLQITLNKSDAERLNEIVKLLSSLLDIEITKSQAIAFLIKNYGRTQTSKSNIDATKPSQPRALKNGLNYQAQVLALKDKLNVSYPRLSQMIGIPETTLKKYASGKQQPQGDNEHLLNDALKRYGIK